MPSFEFTYYLEVIEVDDKAPVFEVPILVHALWEPAEPEVGIPHAAMTIEHVELPRADDKENIQWLADCDQAFIDVLEQAAWDWQKKKTEEFDAWYDDEDRPRWTTPRNYRS